MLILDFDFDLISTHPICILDPIADRRVASPSTSSSSTVSMFSRQRTYSVSSGADRAAQGRPPLLQPGDPSTYDDEPELRRKSFMGIHFGGHRDKDKAGKDAAPSRQGRQSMDQHRTASFTRDPVRNSMSDGARPARFQSHERTNASPPAGHRVVSHPSFASPGANDAARPAYQERERAISLTAMPSPPAAPFQGPAGRNSSRAGSLGSPREDPAQLPPHRPSSGASSDQQGIRGIPESISQRDNMHVGSFAVSRRSPSSHDTSLPAPPQTAKSFQQTRPSQQSPTTIDSRSPRTSSSSRSGNPALTQVLQSYIDLNTVQANKLYASSPPELEMIFARQTNGSPPK